MSSYHYAGQGRGSTQLEALQTLEGETRELLFTDTVRATANAQAEAWEQDGTQPDPELVDTLRRMASNGKSIQAGYYLSRLGLGVMPPTYTVKTGSYDDLVGSAFRAEEAGDQELADRLSKRAGVPLHFENDKPMQIAE